MTEKERRVFFKWKLKILTFPALGKREFQIALKSQNRITVKTVYNRNENLCF